MHPSAIPVVLAKMLTLQVLEQRTLKFALERVLFHGFEPEHEIARERSRDKGKWQEDAEVAQRRKDLIRESHHEERRDCRLERRPFIVPLSKAIEAGIEMEHGKQQ